MRYFKRLKTRDGVVGPIEEVAEPRYKEERAAKTMSEKKLKETRVYCEKCKRVYVWEKLISACLCGCAKFIEPKGATEADG